MPPGQAKMENLAGASQRLTSVRDRRRSQHPVPPELPRRHSQDAEFRAKAPLEDDLREILGPPNVREEGYIPMLR